MVVLKKVKNFEMAAWMRGGRENGHVKNLGHVARPKWLERLRTDDFWWLMARWPGFFVR
jgi:hypothetical protein